MISRKGLFVLKEKALICILAYAMAFLFSYNYYQSDIDKYQEIMLNQAKYEREYKLFKKIEDDLGKPKNASSELFNPALANGYWNNAKEKRSSLMINSFAATTVVLIGAYFYWERRNKKPPRGG